MSDHDREPSPRSGAPRAPLDDEPSPSDPAGAPIPDIAIAASTTSTAAIAAAAEGAPPPFEPLFTLLTNTTNNTTIHPRVHYIFSDDDDASILPGSAPPDPSHRALVLDLAPATGAPEEDSAGGWRVAWASSLSPSFAVTDSSLSVVQQGHHRDDDNGSAMLRIDGVEREPVHLMRGGNGSRSGSPSGAAASGTVGKEDVDALVEDFRRRMGVLRRVVGQGHKRREALDELQQGDFEYEDDGVPEQQQQQQQGVVGEYGEREREEEEPVSPTGQGYSQHEEQRWK